MLSSKSLVRWSKSFEAFAIVNLSLGVNLLTTELGNMGCCSPTIKRSLGIIGSILVTASGVCLIFCRWWITEIREAYQGNLLLVEQHFDHNKPQKNRIQSAFVAGLILFGLGIIGYMLRGVLG